MKTFLPLLIGSLFVLTAAARGDNAKPSLATSVSQFIDLLEKGDAADAAKQFAKDDKAAEHMKTYWKNLKDANAKHDYRKWLEEAGKAPQDKPFRIGGHSYSHMHVVWEKTDAGWRVADVYMCR